MTYKHAINILNEIKSTVYFDEEKEAIDLAIKALSNNNIITCSKCKKQFINTIEKTEYDSYFDLTEYTTKCPYCNTEYTWNDCYWR